MSETATTDSRQATAQRNVEAILDGGERLLERGDSVSISAVAGEAGVSRVTVYSHFSDRRRLLEALVERAVHRAVEAIDSAEPERGAANEALGRLLNASWEELARHESIGRASGAELSGDAMRRAHEAARERIRALAERGRAEGVFRRDLPVEWLVTASLALIHAAAEEVRTGELDPEAARSALLQSVQGLFAGRASS